MLKTDEVTKTGILVKKGLGWVYKPWAIRVFKLYGKSAILTYETNDGEIKGIVKLEDAKIESLHTSSADGKKYAFRLLVRKLAADGTVDASSKVQP
jgi:hypothetical protein